ncbi:hypothetical protein [Vreelandella zhaodongensis]|uniref:hypothetical protein n=1 Tax=Vreelandella zhaodongensis TaxID=1176240 RepID=UPI003EBD3AA6
MEMLEIIKSKEVDIYISFFMTIFGLVLGLIVDSIRQGKGTAICERNETSISVTVNNIVTPPRSGNSPPSKDENLMIVIGFFLLVTGAIYLFNRLEVLNSVYYLTVFVISLWSGGILHSLLKGRFSGWRWFANFIFYGAFFVASFHIVNKAIMPNYAPENFIYSQELINSYGILGLDGYFSMLDVKWFMFHLLGVLFLFFSMMRLTLSTTYFAIMGNYVVSEEGQEPWLARKTRKYAHFWENIILISVFLLVSYYLVSGNFFMWFEYEFPKVMEYFINKILRGS